jgi:hypothetical protein
MTATLGAAFSGTEVRYGSFSDSGCEMAAHK